MTRLACVWCVLAFLSQPACSNTPNVGPGDCNGNADCEGGWVCSNNTCRQLCRTQGDCPNGSYCTVDGMCETAGTGTAPVIETVVANDYDHPTLIVDGLVVTGAVLAQAAFEMRGASEVVPLSARSQTDREVELVFPADVRSGQYELVATNAAGSDQETVQLMLPEITGDLVVQKVNSASTVERIALNRLAHDVQRRITPGCPSGEAIGTVNADGSVTCEPGELSATEVRAYALSGLTSGVVPTFDGGALQDGSISDDGSGSVGIGVATPRAPLDVNGAVIAGAGQGSTSYNIASYFTGENSSAFIHIKTPFSPSIGSNMFHFHVRGYAYGVAAVVDLTFVGYAYGGSGNVQAIGTLDPTNTFNPTVYKGSDGYAYLRFGGLNTYYLTFTVDSLYVGNGRVVEPGELTVFRSTAPTL